MASKVFQNMDLIRLIYGYGDPEHRNSMDYIHQRTKEVLLTHVPATYPYTRGEVPLKDTLTEFFLLRRCRCCSRHSHSKPNIYFGYTHGCRDDEVWLVIDYRTVIVPECKDLGDCNCDCRHKMRKLSEFIERQSHMNTIKYESIG
jgi:hypothetical protein